MPVTDLRIAIHLAHSEINAFGSSPTAPRNLLKTTMTKIWALHKVRDCVNGALPVDGRLDAACPDLLNSVAAAASVHERVEARAAGETGSVCDPRLVVRLPDPSDGGELEPIRDPLVLPATFDELVERHREVVLHLRRQARPSA